MNLIKLEDNGTVNALDLHDKLYPKYKGDRRHMRKWFISNTDKLYKEGKDY